jgi:uncharacterized protein
MPEGDIDGRSEGGTMSTRAVVEDLLDRIGSGDPELVAQAYAEEVDWRLDWPQDEHGADVPWIRDRRTRADVAEHYRSIAEHHDPAQAGVEIERILVDGDDAVVIGTLRNTLRHNGASYGAHFALHLTVLDGLVTRHHVYEDSLAIARAWAAPERVVG